MSSKPLAIIPDGNEDYEFSTSLDGENYFLEMLYNERIDTWHMNLKDADRNVVLAGMPMLTNSQNMVGAYALEDVLTFGEFMIFDISSVNAQDPTQESFGESQKMYYLSIRT